MPIHHRSRTDLFDSIEMSHTDRSAQHSSSIRLQRMARFVPLLILPLFLVLTVAVLPARGATLRLVQRARQPFERLLAPEVTTWSDFAPADWVTALPVTSSVVVASAHGLDPVVAADYAVSTDTGGTWSAWSVAGLSVTGAMSTTQTLAVIGLTFPDGPSANLIRFRIAEIGGALQLSPNYTLRVDTARPASAVTRPANGAVLKVVPAIEGTASDGSGSGVSRVETSIQQSSTDLYWTGTGWVNGEQWLSVTGTASWGYTASPPVWADGTGYTVRSRAHDTAGNTEAPGVGNSFVFDATPPSVALTAPNGGEIWAGGQSHAITWTATDTVGLPLTPIALSVSYDAGGTWSALATDLPNTGSYSWTPPVTDNNQVMVQIEVIDRAGHLGSDRSNAVFTLDGAPPAAPVNLTANPAAWTNAPGFVVSWTNPVDVSPVAGAWYKLDAPPSGPNDGVYVAGTAITHIADIAPATDGVHLIYVWLQDTLGAPITADPLSPHCIATVHHRRHRSALRVTRRAAGPTPTVSARRGPILSIFPGLWAPTTASTRRARIRRMARLSARPTASQTSSCRKMASMIYTSGWLTQRAMSVTSIGILIRRYSGTTAPRRAAPACSPRPCPRAAGTAPP